jgi:hypothetical protein
MKRMKSGSRTIALLLTIFFSVGLHARPTAEYLPADTDPDPSVPTPESVLGFDVGDWHVSHDKLVYYMRSLAASSPRVSIRTIGFTHEQRPLLQLAITSEANQQSLESLRAAHLDGSDTLVIWMGYSVHGDEPSGSNASLLVAYYLAASRSAFVQELLDNSIVLIDPSVNPDGLDRFASWVNSNAGKAPVSDPQTRQHVQNWPEGRTNHYLFDLNRDWLPVVQPESRARVSEFHRWQPHVLTDHHEQDRYPGFFFQPGVPSRQNPLTPPDNLELTRALAGWHSAAMDAAGQPHFTEDAYDDFYYGKGSTYPDINGSIGILFEQRAVLGQEILTSNGVETFQMAIANQVRMSLSTLQGSWALKDRLIRYRNGFGELMTKRAASRNFSGWVVGDDGDPGRARAFLDVLDLHRIEYQPLGEPVRAGDHEFSPDHAWVIPARQPQFGLLEAMMEQRTEFQDETFYDVSAWTQPLAYNLPFATVSRLPRTVDHTPNSTGIALDREAPAYTVPWNQIQAAPLLQRLLDRGAKVRVSLKPFSAQTGRGLQAHEPGTLVIQRGIQDRSQLADILDLLDEALLSGVEVRALQSTMTAIGPDLGSVHFPIVQPPKPVILGGRGTSNYEPGEAWFLLDARLGLAAPIIETANLERTDLAGYTHLLLQDGDYSVIAPEQQLAIARWVSAGGILLTVGQAATWAENLCFEADPTLCPAAPTAEPATAAAAQVPPAAYGDFADDKAQHVIGGAIVASMLDLSHPLAFGFRRPDLPLMRRGTTLLKPSQNAYVSPVRYTKTPLMAGFIGAEQLAHISERPAVIAEVKGKGLVVRFANNPLFRGFWRGTERLYINALYFGQVIEATDLPVIVPPTGP